MHVAGLLAVGGAGRIGHRGRSGTRIPSGPDSFAALSQVGRNCCKPNSASSLGWREEFPGWRLSGAKRRPERGRRRESERAGDSLSATGLVRAGSSRPRRGRSGRWRGHRAWSSGGWRGRQCAGPSPKHLHIAPQVRSYPASVAPPTIAVAALLELARWMREHVQLPGAPPCVDPSPDRSPPDPESADLAPDGPAPLGPAHPSPAATPGASGRPASRPASGDGRSSGGRP
jgi:hypothetical protein